ncbi:MAG: serine protease [Stigonema ocellatum SAG 48.90 = DSM 106950]|nr:serine protease [Stigonema ocellatum SAG 48.90 = DSM 106950]
MQRQIYLTRVSPALIGVLIALVQTQVAVALSAPEVSKIAQEITVQIQSKKPRYGCGVIIKRSGNTYTVLTTAHVVEIPDKYEIITPDEKHYPLNYSTVKQMPGLDLAVVQFTSSENYTVAKIGNSDASIAGTMAYVAGYPEPTFAINKSIYTFTTGTINANANASKALREGYALVYSNETKKGMSGGPVMNDLGELIGVNGREDKAPNYDKTGFYLGIPINTFLRGSATVGVDMGVSAPALVVTEPKADDFLIQGRGKYDKGDFKGAIANYTDAIRLNPNYATAYNNRGLAFAQLGDTQKAIGDYNQALRIDPQLALAYYNRGSVQAQLGDKQKAIGDYNQALRIDPKLAIVYNSRGLARAELGDTQGAIGDYNQALHIDSKLALAYNNRGAARAQLGEKQEAIGDYNQALRIDPNLAVAYNNRGGVRAELGNKQEAIGDYNQALLIDPSLAVAYYNRGIAHRDLGDKQAAIADLHKAADLFRQQGRTDNYQKALELIRMLSNP